MNRQLIQLKEWQDILEYIDTNDYQIPMSTVEYIMQHASLLPKDAYSKGQLASKSWLLQSLSEVLAKEPMQLTTVGIVGSCHKQLHGLVGLFGAVPALDDACS